MDSTLLSTLSSLSLGQKKAFEQAGLHTTSDVLLISSAEVAKKLRITPLQAEGLLRMVANDIQPAITTLHDMDEESCFSTGDRTLDATLNGGIRIGRIYDICGESATGKTQLALQLALVVQLSPLTGLCGSTAYITTTGALPTSRLVQINLLHPLLDGLGHANLSNIHTCSCSTSQMLVQTIAYTLPALAVSLTESTHPLRMIVIDSLPPLFRTMGTSSTSLFERSRTLAHIAALLRLLAKEHHLAVLVLNEVSDVFDRTEGLQPSPEGTLPMIYKDQARWFSKDGPHGQKEASLGLVWANEIDTRIMLCRTGMRWFPDREDGTPPAKRRRLTSDSRLEENIGRPTSAAVRRLSIVFSSIARPAKVEFVISEAGISTVDSKSLTTEGTVVHDNLQDSQYGSRLPSGMSAAELAFYAEGLDAPDLEYESLLDQNVDGPSEHALDFGLSDAGNGSDISAPSSSSSAA